MSIIDKILSETAEKKEVKPLHGLYLEPDLGRILNMLAKKGGRGAKSEITNEAFRMLFKAKGLM